MRSVEQLMRLMLDGKLKPDTENDWSDDESAAIKSAYRQGDESTRQSLFDLFPAECSEV